MSSHFRSFVYMSTQRLLDLGADYMSQAGSVEGLSLSAEITAQPGITRLRLNLEAVVGKVGYIEEHESSVFILANPLFWRIIFSFM